jgi:hypothetical protein
MVDIQSWTRSEVLCLEYAQRAADWLNDFYAAGSNTFRVAYSSGDQQSTNEDPNAATSLIGIVFDEINPYWDISLTRGQLDQRVAASRETLAKAALAKVLPLKSFGPLPLFSTAYLARHLPSAPSPLTVTAYAIALRRVLYAMFQQFTSTTAPQRVDRLHPWLLYSCVKALLRFRDLISEARTPSRLADLAAFVARLHDDTLITPVVKGADKRGAVYGTGSDATAFRRTCLDGLVTASLEPGAAIETLLQFAEDAAIHHVMADIAASTQSASSRCDPSSLVFSLYILVTRNSTRHAALIGQGSRVVLSTIQDGIFPSAWPFQIDSQGRAMFVPSVEIANALLSITLKRGAAVSGEELQEVLSKTRTIEAHLVENSVQIEIMVSPGVAKVVSGWCSDRSPSRTRVDSWITVHVLGFFLRRLSLIRAAKRADVLTRYSWLPSNRCQPKWEELEDPDLGLEPVGLKDRILAAVDADPANRDRAPMFLLYGPPGASKTSLVQGLAHLKGWDLLTLSPSDFVADSLDRIEQRARAIFLDLLRLDRCVVLMDEMDSLLRDRELLRGAGTIIEFVVPALLPKLQELRDYVLRRNMAVFFVSCNGSRSFPPRFSLCFPASRSRYRQAL